MKTYNTVAIETDIHGVDSNEELSALFARALELCQTAETSPMISSPRLSNTSKSSENAKTSETVYVSSSSNTQNLSCENVTYCIQHAESVDLQPIPLPVTNVQEYLQSMESVSTQIERKDEDGMEATAVNSGHNAVVETSDDNTEHGLENTSHLNRHLKTWSTEERVRSSAYDKGCTSQDMNAHEDRSPALKSKMVTDNNSKTTVIKHTKTKSYCTYCGKAYTSQGPFKKHLAKHEVRFFLKEGVGDENQETMQEAQLSELNSGESSSFGNVVAEAQDHVNQHGVQQGNDNQTYTEERTYKCKFCDKTFPRKFDFVKHLQIHSGEKVHKCEVCDKGFTRKWYLAEHLRTHTGERPHKCELCNVAFVNKANLNKHIQIHSGVRQHKCGFCDKAFMRKHDIIRHLRIHTGERPYKCKYCEKAFMIKQHLVEHLRRHTGERPHKCGYCDMAFVTKGCLNKHVKTHTGQRQRKR